MRHFLFGLCIVLMLATGHTCYASKLKQGWHLSTFMGMSQSTDNHFAVHLEDQPDQVFRAKWKNRPFEDSHWWAVRLEKWNNNKSIGFEAVHHKIYLANTNEIIKNFSISDGYNLIYLNIGRQRGPHIYRLGIGFVLAHADASIAGRPRHIIKGPKGHRVAGPSMQLNYERYLWENNTHFISIDTKLTGSYAVTPVSSNNNEYAMVPDIAFHISLGLGSKPQALKQKNILKKASYALPLLYPYITGTYVIGECLLPEGY